MSSTTVVADSGPPVSGYQGGGLTRQVTSNHLRLQPVESLLGRAGRDEELRERERRADEEAGAGAQSGGKGDSPQEPREPKNGEELVITEGEGGKGEGYAEEWTFPDGGLKAWSVIFGCWLFSCNVQGYGMIWGAIINDLQKNHHPSTSLSLLNLIIGLQNFGLNAAPFVTGRLGEIYGFKRMIAIGSISAIIMLVISACTVDSLPCLFIFQGILLGIAHGFSLPLFMTIPSQWFSKRRGLATGITVSGTGFGGGIASLIMRGILPSLGYRNSLLVYTGISAIVYVVAWLLIEVRKPPLKAAPQRFDTKTGLPPGIHKDYAFWCLLASVFFGVFGFLTPSYYLTSMTEAVVPGLDPNSLKPAVPLIVSNFTLGIGRMVAGSLADYFGPVNCLIFSFFAGGTLQLAMWSTADSYGLIIGFAALVYFLGGWFFFLMPQAAAQLFGFRGLASIVGYVVTSQSPGQLAGASISGVVLNSTGSYANVAYYAGTLMLVGSLCMVPARVLREPRIFARY